MSGRFDWRKRYKGVNAFYPCYGADGGNFTTILFNGGETQEYRKRTDTAAEEACRAFGTTRKALRGCYGRRVGLSVDVPLPLAPGLVLVPLDMRAPLGRGQGAVGYIVLAKYRECCPVKAKDGVNSRVIFADGSSAPCCFQPQAVEERVLRARQVEVEYNRMHTVAPGFWPVGQAGEVPLGGPLRFNGRRPALAIIGYAYSLEEEEGRPHHRI